MNESPFSIPFDNPVIFIQNSVQYFFDNAIFPIYSDDRTHIIINLLDYFPMLKQGYALLDTVVKLMDMYEIMHDLKRGNKIYPDDLMKRAFGGNIPAYRYNRELTMEEAFGGYPPNYLSTFQVLERNSLDYHFNINKIDETTFADVIELNYMVLLPIGETEAYLQNPKFIDALNTEYAIIRELTQIITYILYLMNESTRKITVVDIMYTSTDEDFLDYLRRNIVLFDIETDYSITLLKRLLADDRVTDVDKLSYAIKTDDPNVVDLVINNYDPRANNYEAYNLAIERGKSLVIDRVKKAIAERNFLEKQTFQTITGYHGAHQELYAHSRTLLAPK
jgi:hypothetical protein